LARPPAPLITIEAITEAALELVDQTGDFSLPKLARRIGVSQSSIYNHVAGREEILELMRRRVIELSPHAPVAGLPWDAALRTLVRSYRDGFARHPRLAPLLVLQTVVDTEVMALYEELAETLETAGFSGPDVLSAISTVDAFALGAALDLAAPEVVWAPPSSGYPALNRALRYARSGEQRARDAFEFGLDVLVAGLRGRVEASGQAVPG
jgi:AcrR family transcriptional regulator